jgi:hypothetical protein
MPSAAIQWNDIRAAFAGGMLIPYLGPGLLALQPDSPVPVAPEPLADFLAERVTLPHKIRRRLTAGAQFIENFKHRKSLVDLMQRAFAVAPAACALQQALAGAPQIRLIVSVWYDDAMRVALAGLAEQPAWGQVQGLSQSEHFGSWFRYYAADGAPSTAEEAAGWHKLLYQPIGAHAPAANYLVSDSDYVEVLTEIDIQTPIPPLVQTLREGRHFLFLGCRFNDQLQRTFARQIIKRSSSRHWAVLEGEITPNERRFMAEYGIEQIDMPLTDFAAAWL